MRIQDKYEVASVQDIGGRKEQQDRVAILWHDEACLIVLADGLGGHDHGAFAAQTVVDVADEVFNADPRAAAAELLDKVVTKAHKRISARVRRKLSRSIRAYPGTTCLLLHLDLDKATWTHLGDSRLYRYQGGGLVQHTADHTFPEGGMSACLGAGFSTLPPLDIGTAELSMRDSLVLCSDGLWENMPDNDDHYMGDALQRHGVSAGVRQLVSEARSRGGDYCDNISVAAVRCTR